MPLSAGDRLGAYEIVAPLGAGGMGEVYRARDTKLGREVAIKVLPAAVAQDGERLGRFKREAQVLASLNHPNIGAIYGLDEAGGKLFLVLELVPGEDLAAHVKRGPMPAGDALEVARQIALALEEAHDKGIVHRDLKPANVKLTGDGKVKVLDFGLAKAYASDPSGTGSFESGNSPTMTHAATMAGMILGTAAYMSPEQARAKAVDKRADVWAFGVVLYEMLAGAPLFDGETVSDTLAAVLTRELDTKSLPSATPPPIRRLLRRCLEKNPKNRLHDIADARIVIDDVLAGRPDLSDAPVLAGSAVEPRAPGWPGRLVWLGAGAILGALALGAFGLARRSGEPPPPAAVHSLTYSGKSRSASMGADGRNMAFVSDRDGTQRLWVKQMASGEEVALTAGTDEAPRIAPDGSSVLFLRRAARASDLCRLPLIGGEPRRLASEVVSADWSPDGKRIAFLRDDGQRTRVVLIPADGGAETVLAETDAFLRFIAFSPDGTRLAVESAPRVNTITGRMLATIDVPSGARRDVYRLPAGSVNSGPRWDGDDALLFAFSASQAGRGQAILQRLTLGGSTPRAIFSFVSLPLRIELAGPGALIFDGGGTHRNLAEVNTDGTLGRMLTGGPAIDRQPAFSPDGKRIIFSSDRSGSLDLWSLDVQTGAVRRVTFDAADDWDPHYSPDGKHLLWSSTRGGHFEIWMADADGTGARQVTQEGFDAENPTMSADGSWIVYSTADPAALGIWKIRPDGTEATHLLKGSYQLPELAPKTGWIAAIQTGQANSPTHPVKVIRIEDGSAIAETVILGRGGNVGRSRWMPDGRTLVSWGDNDANERVLFRQPIVPGRDTTSERVQVAIGDDQRKIDTFGVSPVDGRIVVAAGWVDTDVMMADGISGIGASLPKRGPQ